MKLSAHGVLVIALVIAVNMASGAERNVPKATSADIESLEACVLETAASHDPQDCVGLLSGFCRDSAAHDCETFEMRAWITLRRDAFNALPRQRALAIASEYFVTDRRHVRCLEQALSCNESDAALTGSAIALLLASEGE